MSATYCSGAQECEVVGTGLDDAFIKMIMEWRHTSGFNVHNEVRIKPDNKKGIENLVQYIIRNIFSLEKLISSAQDFTGGVVTGCVEI